MRVCAHLVLLLRLLWLGYDLDGALAELELVEREERKERLRVVEGDG